MTITGSGFTGATEVRFGAALASFTVNSDTSITAIAPPGTGSVDVTVTTPFGTSATSSADLYTYVGGNVSVSQSPSGWMIIVVIDSKTGIGTYNFNYGPSVPFSLASTISVSGGSIVLLADNNPVEAMPGVISFQDGLRIVYSDAVNLILNDVASVNAIAGPATEGRSASFVGLSAEEGFVQALYLAELGRAGSKAELDGWVAQLPGGTAGTIGIVTAIQQSPEARDHLVKSWYAHYLGRQANGTEEQGFVNALLSGQTEEQVFSQLLGSAEFFARAQSLALVPGGTADQQFSQALYRLMLGRDGSAGELAGWANSLSTLGRAGVALRVLQSTEARTNVVEGYYNALLHRPGDPQQVQVFVQSGLDAASLRRLFESSLEFFAKG